MKALAQSTIGALLIAFALAYIGPSLDGATRNTTSATDAAFEAIAPLDIEVLACQAVHGANASAIALPDGSHRCTDKHGRRLPRPATPSLQKEPQ